MGNECPECQLPTEDCKMRDVFKEQPKNRDDLDLSHIKKGEYKKKGTLPKDKQNDIEQISLGLNFGQSLIMDAPQKKSKKSSSPIKEEIAHSSASQLKRPLTLEGGIQTLELKKGVRYTGGTVEKQPHERGQVTWDDGAVLNAQFFLGQLAEHEKVYMTLPDGSTYEGQVEGGKANGKGKLTLPDGCFFEGTWKDDEPHGFGRQKMLHNCFYEGSFEGGAKKGKGKYYFEEGMYQGLFENDQFHGEGILVLNDGRSIRGTWRHGVLEGRGQMEWKTGQKYVGEFSRGLRQGQGTYYFSDGREWVGEWKDDVQHGFGSYQIRGETIKSVWHAGVKKEQLREIDMHRA